MMNEDSKSNHTIDIEGKNLYTSITGNIDELTLHATIEQPVYYLSHADFLKLKLGSSRWVPWVNRFIIMIVAELIVIFAKAIQYAFTQKVAELPTWEIIALGITFILLVFAWLMKRYTQNEHKEVMDAMGHFFAHSKSVIHVRDGSDET